MKYGQLTIKSVFVKGKNRKVVAECTCGDRREYYLSNLLTGKTGSCGCRRSETTRKRSIGNRYGETHGLSHSGEYNIYYHMLHRCNNDKNQEYHRYGGRGIKVCESWLGDNGFERFVEDMGERPSKEHSIDRIDNELGYSPDNCRWATRKQQQNNLSVTRRFTIDGVSKTISEWAELTGVNRETVRSRLKRGTPIYG